MSADYEVLVGDCREKLRELAAGTVHTCITSPPYFGLRDYGVDGQLGLEPTPDRFVAALVDTFREVRRVLRKDGTLWLNLGDSYAGGGCGSRDPAKWPKQSRNDHRVEHTKDGLGLPRKSLIGIPWRVALALQADGWVLRQDIIWSKPNPMPESMRDRCTRSHEYLFMFTKSRRYHYDAEAIKEPMAESSMARLAQDVDAQAGSDSQPGRGGRPMKAVGSCMNFRREGSKRGIAQHGQNNGTHRAARADSTYDGYRNKRSVWTVSTKPFRGAHFATFPPDLIEPCILAGCPKGGTVLDPFGGSGTTAGVAVAHGRNAIVCELNPEYAALIPARVDSILKRLGKLMPANDNTPVAGQVVA